MRRDDLIRIRAMLDAAKEARRANCRDSVMTIGLEPFHRHPPCGFPLPWGRIKVRGEKQVCTFNLQMTGRK